MYKNSGILRNESLIYFIKIDVYRLQIVIKWKI